jgi:hypothetical protein
MFESEEDKFLYLVGCALNGSAAAPSDISKITRQAYGIAEEMLILINKLKPSVDCTSAVSTGASTGKEEREVSVSEPASPVKSPVLPAFINKAATANAGAGVALRDALLLKEPIKLDDLASHDKGWNYTPWGKS